MCQMSDAEGAAASEEHYLGCRQKDHIHGAEFKFPAVSFSG